MDHDLNVKPENVQKITQKKHLHDFKVGNIFLNRIQRVVDIKQKINK